MARTAVIAGTATAVSGSVRGHQQAGAQQQAAASQQAAAQQQAAADSQAQLADMQAQLAATQQQAALDKQAAETEAQLAEMRQQLAAQAPPAPAAGGSDDLMTKLKGLADMKAAGLLTDSEFASAKAQLLG